MVHRPRKSLGQNFLVDPNLQQKIVDALAPEPGDEVLEIGPGTGALTHRIAGHVRRLVAVELDGTLADKLDAEIGGREDTDILHRDILEVETADIFAEPERLKVIGNIPYNITTPLIFRLLDRTRRPAVMVLMVQREVADRILASPGTKAYGALSVGVRAVATAERLFEVRRTAFRPMPDVDSTVIRITPIRPSPLDPAEEDELRTLTRAAFSRRRKQLQRILRSAPEYDLGLAEIDSLTRETGLDPVARPEVLAPEDFIALTRALRGRERTSPPPSAPDSPTTVDSATQRETAGSGGSGRPTAPSSGTEAGSLTDHSEDRAHLRMLGIVAHELRSPLTAIMGYQELLRDGFYGRLEEAAVEPVRRIGSSARHLLTLIDGMEHLVQAPRAAADEWREKDAPSDGAVTPEDCLAEAQREAAARNIALDIRSPAKLDRLHEDGDRACSTLELFVYAALKLATDDVLRLTIEQDDRRTSVSLVGPGLERYRLPTERAVAAGDVEIDIDSGAALRLAIAYRLAISLGGRLFSREAAEPTLVLELPAAAIRRSDRDHRDRHTAN